MHAFKALIWFAAVVMVFFGASWAGAAEPVILRLTPLVADVLTAPHAVRGSDGRMHLVYEIRVANVTGGRISLERIAVVDAKLGTTIATLDTEAIAGRLSLGGRRGSELAGLGPFQFGVVFMHMALERNAPMPTALAHVVEASSENSEQRSFDAAG